MVIETQGSTATAPTQDVLDGLNDLLQLDYDAISAYQAAIEKLDSAEYSQQISGFLRDHERHVRDLTDLIQQLGGTPANEPHATAPLKEGLQRLAAAGGDRGVLMAFRANEFQVRSKYDDYAAKANRWPADAKRVVDRNALDEERHYRWVSQTLEALGEEAGAGGLSGATARVRESAGRIGEAADRVRTTGQRRAKEVRGRVDEQVREHTLQSVLVTFAAGFVIGRLLR